MKICEKIPYLYPCQERIKKIIERLNKGSLENIQLEIKGDPPHIMKINGIPIGDEN